MDLSCLAFNTLLLSIMIASYFLSSVSVEAQRNLSRQTRERTQYLLVGAKPECNFNCKKSRRRRFCGSDGRTFTTECQARRAKCLDPMLTTKPGKCKDATCVQARSYFMRKTQASSRLAAHIPTCTSDGWYAPKQCNTDMGYCWCVTSDGRMVAGSAVENSEPSCNTGNVRRSTESCPSAKRSALFASVRSRSVREFRKATPLAEVPSSSNEILRLALSWKFSTLDKNKNENVNSRELRHLVKKLHARECGSAFSEICDVDKNRQITEPEWMTCLFTAVATSSERLPVSTTTPTTETLNIEQSAVKPVAKSRCLNNDETSLIDKVRNLILKEHRQANLPQTTGTTEERENSAILWKFSQLDRNGNGAISAREIKSLRRKYRKDSFKECFVGICDLSEDGNLSENEWSVCFIANRPRTCVDERREALKLQRAQEEVYVPSCEDDDPRFFNQVQCHANTGYCWCTSRKTGRPIPGTSVRGSRPVCNGAQPTVAPTAASLPGCTKPQAFMKSLRSTLVKEMNRQTHTDAADASDEELQEFTEEVGTWFFEQLDKNHDNLLSKREAKVFKKKLRRKATPKRCLRKFMGFCDENKNKKVTQFEFSACLQIANDASMEALSHSNRLPILEDN